MNSSVAARYLEHIQKEFDNAEEARRNGKEGRARVCARRAAGFAIAWYQLARGEPVRENDALLLLTSIQADEAIPQSVRDAAKRLAAKVTADFNYAFATDPLDDARTIVDYVRTKLC